jgi:hypothetical protein
MAGDENSLFQSLAILFKNSVISLCQDILFPTQKQCYIMLSTITKPVEIQQIHS